MSISIHGTIHHTELEKITRRVSAWSVRAVGRGITSEILAAWQVDAGEPSLTSVLDYVREAIRWEEHEQLQWGPDADYPVRRQLLGIIRRVVGDRKIDAWHISRDRNSPDLGTWGVYVD